jgi:hypothetical protein
MGILNVVKETRMEAWFFRLIESAAMAYGGDIYN